MIQSDDSKVRELASSMVATDDPWLAAVAVEKFVHDYVREKDFSTAFATAADVARERSGDCTEHAVLTAALCRARGIPARIMVGLVYVSKLQGFGFHMWNEVWVGDRWVPIDATIGRGGIGATHLALARTSLDAEDSFASFLPVVQVIGRLKLEVLEAE
jgi:transglutaminase-like putative cysteine protease